VSHTWSRPARSGSLVEPRAVLTGRRTGCGPRSGRRSESAPQSVDWKARPKADFEGSESLPATPCKTGFRCAKLALSRLDGHVAQDLSGRTPCVRLHMGAWTQTGSGWGVRTFSALGRRGRGAIGREVTPCKKCARCGEFTPVWRGKTRY
jgi:hypothetical protein